MKSTITKIVIATAVLTTIGCHTSGTKDPITGEAKARDCVDQLNVTDSYRGTYEIYDSKMMTLPTRGITRGTAKKIVRLYNHLTCDSYVEIDLFSEADSFFSIGVHPVGAGGVEIAKGQNRIDFVVEECLEEILVSQYKCMGISRKDSGYFVLDVQPIN